MAELVLLTFERRAFDAMHRAALRGDAAALREMEGLWDEYRDAGVACFLCDAVAEHPPFSMMLPEHADPSRLIAAPLCAACRDLPKMVQLNRCIRLLKRMWSTNGKVVTFSFAPRRR